MKLYYFEASLFGLLLAHLTARAIKAEIMPLKFSFYDARDQNGDLLWWKVSFKDLADLQQHMREYPEFQAFIRNHKIENRKLLFLIRRILDFDAGSLTLAKMLLLIRVFIAREGHKTAHQPLIMFFLRARRPWLTEVGKWAQKKNVCIVPMNVGIDFYILRRILRSEVARHCMKQALYYWMVIKYKIKRMRSLADGSHRDDPVRSIRRTGSVPRRASPKIAVEYYGHLNLYSPDLNSDLFFCQGSNIPKEDILIYFKHAVFSASDREWDEIRKYGMSAVAINSRAAVTPHIPTFKYRNPRIRMDYSKGATQIQDDSPINRDLYKRIEEYNQLRDYWIKFFSQYNVKLHVSWHKYESDYFPMADALDNTGGVSVLYQRSFENASNPLTVTAADVVFGFSKIGAHLGKDLNSQIPYYVITGYLGDHRFHFVRKEAEHVRDCLRKNGAKKIITYFDENSIDDDRWNIGHKETQSNYAYLLNKVLETPCLGLIFKPKVLLDLRKRLGDVSGLLDRAEETGRCFIFEKGGILGSHPPATAALAADIAIHGHFFAATAGVESALTGTKTLMLDREGYSISPLYKLGLGRVIFKDWDDLWKACQDHWNAPDGMPGLGDWSSVIDDLDPFRDGRAAQRMATYLEWLMEGYKGNLPRETILADAAERYTKIWGKDKIFSVNCDSKEYSNVC